MLSPLVGVAVISYILMVYISFYVMLSVRNPLRRSIYLLMIFILMLVGSMLVRLYLFKPAGFVVETYYNGSSRVVKVNEIYADEPYNPMISLLLTGLSLIPVSLSIVSSLELIGLRWRR